MSTSAHSGAGDSVRVYLRDVVMAEPGVGRPLADRLADRLHSNIEHVVELYRDQSRSAKKPSRKPAVKAVAFDPFLFGAVVVLERDGRDALLMLLDGVESAEHLHAIAEAQHLDVDTGLRDAGALRLAILAAAQERIADRRAASSG